VIFPGKIGFPTKGDPEPGAENATFPTDSDVSSEDFFTSNIPLKYFDFEANHFNGGHVYLGAPLISGLPVTIENPDLSESINKPFAEIDANLGSYRAKFIDPADVDADGILEKIYHIPVAMNHGAAMIQIIKNNQVIFESRDTANRWFEKTVSGDGFYLLEGLQDEDGAWNVGNRRTRYVYKDGKFIPVWHQDEYKLKVQNTELSDSQVTQLLIEKFREYPNKFKTWINKECVSYWVDDKDPEKYSIEIREWHSKECGGDPNTAPMLATFKMDKRNYLVYFDDYIPIYRGGEIPLSEYVELRAK